MSRYTNTFYTNLTFEEFNAVVSGILTREGFKQLSPNYEQTWKKGVGFLTAPQYVVAAYNPQNSTITISAYIKFALFPGVYIGEMGLSGAFGCIPKQALKSKVTVLEQTLSQTAYNKQVYMQQASYPQPGVQQAAGYQQQVSYQQPYAQQNYQNYNNQ